MSEQPVIQEPVVITDTSSTTQSATESPVTEQPVIAETTPVETSIPEIKTPETTTPVESVTPEVSDTAWKDEMKKQVGDDAKLLKIIDKFKTPKDLLNSNAELQKKLSSTRPLPELPENATPEQLKEYREAVGVPEEPKGYELGVEVPEEYKAGLEKYLEIAHQNNRPASLVKQAVSDYLKVEELRANSLVQQIAETQQATEKQLKDNWGINYETNKAVVNTFFEKTFGEDADSVLKAYLPDGTRLGDNAKVMDKLLEVSRNTVGAATIVSNNIMKDVATIQERLVVLDKMAMDSKSPYWGANHEQFKREHDQARNNLDDLNRNRR